MAGLSIAQATLQIKAALEQPDKDWVASLLLSHIVNKPSSYLMAWPEAELTSQHIQSLESALKQLQQGKPLAYVLGSQAFWNLDLLVTPDTLIPRADTEVVIEQALNLDLPEQAAVLDLGTGTGAIALALAQEKPAWQITAVDNSPEALEVAKNNAGRNQIDTVQFIESNWFEQVQGQFDLIISNPPYIETHDEHLPALKYEPLSALVSGADGLDDIRRICGQCRDYLKPDGYLLFEHGYNQAPAVQLIMQEHGLLEIISGKDYGDNWRWTQGKRDENLINY